MDQCAVEWCNFDHSEDDWHEKSEDFRSRTHERNWPSGVALIWQEQDLGGEYQPPQISLPKLGDDDAMHTLEQAEQIGKDLVAAATAGRESKWTQGH